MKKTILIQLFILFAFSTISMAQRPNGGNINQIHIPANGIRLNSTAQNQVSDCITSFVLGQPTNGSIKTIEVQTQGYRNTDGDCVFDVFLYTPDGFPDPQNVKWEIDGVSVPPSTSADNRTLSVPVPESGVSTVVFVSYTIGSQQGAGSRTFYVQ